MTRSAVRPPTDDAAGLFKLLGDETRITILRELYRHWRRSPEEPCLPFSTLYERVGGGDSGQFNYHLKRLEDRLVERRTAGYTLTPRGIYLAQLIADDDLSII